MKIVLVLLTFSLSCMAADELTRIETIVKDITKLKTDYADLEVENSKYKSALISTQNENDVLRTNLKLYSNYEAKDKAYKKEIEALKDELKTLNLRFKKLQADKNEFPQLQMKKKYQKKPEPKKEVVVTEITDDGEIVFFEATTFRVNKDAKIFDGIYGIEIDIWDKSTSFTSNQKTSEWIKITGYFVNKTWQSAPKEMWVKASDADKR